MSMMTIVLAAVTLSVGPDRELKSMIDARDWIRAERKAKRLAPDEKVEVIFDDGVYVQSDVRLSGKTRDDFVTYRAKNPHQAKLVTGTFVTGEVFSPVTDEKVLAELDESVRCKVLVADLSAVCPKGFEKIPDVIKGVPKPNLYVNGEEMTLARWPNLSDDPEKCWTGFQKVVDHGWAETNSPNPELRVPHAGSFVYEKSDRPNRWKIEKGVWLFGYWTHDWLDITVRLASWDPAKKTMTHADKVQNGVGGGTLGRKERRFYALNVFSELDVPGEYYIDREAKLLYLYPTQDLNGAEILLATDEGSTVKADEVKGLVLDGFTVMGSAGNAFGIGSCEDCVVRNCRFTNIGGLVISVTGKRNLVRDCEIFNVGQSGIAVGGGDEKTLTPGSNVVENCHIYNYAQHVRTYRPAIQLWGVGNVVRHNEIHDAPHNAMLFGGNDNVIEYNEVYRCVLETADSGAFYTGRNWQTQGNVLRYNYIHDCGPKNGHIMGTVGIYFDDCDCGDAVYGNVFAHMGRAVFIGGGRDHPVENNVFYDCYNSIQMDNRGMEWKQWNTSKPSWNFEEKCEKLNYRNPPWSVKYPRLANIMNDHPREPLYNPMRLNVFVYPKQNEIGCYPHVTNASPRLAPIERNLGLRRKGYKARNDQWRLDFGASVVLEDTPESPCDLGFANLAKDDFSLREDAPLFRLLPGFRRVPFEKMGRLDKDGKALHHSSATVLKGDGDVERANDRSFLANEAKAEEVRPRSGIGNFLGKLAAGKAVTVAYLGGSITEMKGWRTLSADWLRRMYPGIEIRDINAGLGGTGSNLGVFRCGHDVLAHDPDLVFVEFATNDRNERPESLSRSMEGIVRQIWKKDPKTDIVFVYTIIKSMVPIYNRGVCPPATAEMERLADYYGIPSIDFGPRVAADLKAGNLTIEAFAKDGVHPGMPGHGYYLQSITNGFAKMREIRPVDHAKRMTGAPYIQGNLENAKMVEIPEGALSVKWETLSSESELMRKFSKRTGPIHRLGTPGDSLSFRFNGTQCAIYDFVGPDGGQVWITVDGKKRDKPIPRFDGYCTYHRLSSLHVFTGADGVHDVTIVVDKEQPSRQAVASRLGDPETELSSPKYQGRNFWPVKIMIVGELVK